MELTEKDKKVIGDVFGFFYSQGGIRSRQMVQDCDEVLAKLFARTEEPKPPKVEPKLEVVRDEK